MIRLSDKEKKEIKDVVDPVMTEWAMIEDKSFLPDLLSTLTECVCQWSEHADRDWWYQEERDFIEETILARNEFQGEYV